jgi:hypothetical protein
MNSPFRDMRTPDAGRYIKFPGPQILDASDLNEILAPNVLFARKFDAKADREVLVKLASKLGYASFA